MNRATESRSADNRAGRCTSVRSPGCGSWSASSSARAVSSRSSSTSSTDISTWRKRSAAMAATACDAAAISSPPRSKHARTTRSPSRSCEMSMCACNMSPLTIRPGGDRRYWLLMRIVQMSDLHVGEGLFRPDLLHAAITETNELAPDLVVVAGDLTMEGYRGEFERCRQFLDELACRNVVVTMGNHDARNVGYRHFEDFFGARDSVTTVPVAEGRARVVAIDSTKPDVDEGEVGREHYAWLDAALRGWTDGPRIVVIHHHILAVPGTGRDVNNLRDAGDVMAILRELEVDLVLSGHRHVPYVWSISGVRVVHSGTVSSLRVRGTMPPSYNVIEIDADEVRIAMRQPGQGLQGEEPLAQFARRPVTTSEFHPPLERFVRYDAVRSLRPDVGS